MGGAGTKFKTPEDALKAWAKDVLDASISSGLEFAGKLYKNADGTWSYSPSTAGTDSHSRPQNGETWVNAVGAVESYDIHSHGSYEGHDTPAGRLSIDQFSNQDASKSEQWMNPKTQFMLTPGGDLRQYLPTFSTNSMGLNGQVLDLGNINGKLPLLGPQF